MEKIDFLLLNYFHSNTIWIAGLKGLFYTHLILYVDFQIKKQSTELKLIIYYYYYLREGPNGAPL